MNNDWSEYVEYYLKKLRSSDSENAYFSLLEVDHTALPLLIDAYYVEKSIRVKEVLIEVIYRQRRVETFDFLADVLQSDDQALWRTALDGIVTINSEVGIQVLEREKSRLLALTSRNAKERIEWVEEAIDQLRENIETTDE